MIEIHGLTKRFGRVTAVDDLSFVARPGSVTGFLGPNGAGKSTTMRMVLGLDRPTSGFATVCGRPVRELRHPARTVGAVLDAGWVLPQRSARAHLRWIAAASGLPASRVDEVIAEVGLTTAAGRRVRGFSLGMRQRLGIAAALLGDPEVLLLDEPVNGLDPDGILWLRGLVRGYAEQGRTVLLSSHLLAELAGNVDEVVVIGRGRLITQQAIGSFLASSAATRVRVRVDDPDRLRVALTEGGHTFGTHDERDPTVLTVSGLRTEEVGALARTAGCTVWELTAQTASLEEAFLKATKTHSEHVAGEAGNA
ncbi:ABC-2 type transport system ATP-binding protein [Krasilnikovia cinnamomea]|uniref:ABC-2 type transport system ATP-binding protein n=1 Tax=Krasilnikovia cinnamomea TaxID=349313 RepID=A0A4Q7ZLS0_9ACTN|nr:ATP-binding cassette domain-containing protein [Krasilnikovia cinnamomea]RZU51333.1 ABC-2 type transport system ATP-binding protein [Krasilnikovia cinnamomea]